MNYHTLRDRLLSYGHGRCVLQRSHVIMTPLFRTFLFHPGEYLSHS